MAYSDDQPCAACGAAADAPCESTCLGRVTLNTQREGWAKSCVGQPGDRQAVPVLPTDSLERKDTPIYSGVLRYFPRALAYVAKVSKAGNDKHNPGQPLHWSKGKSNDHGDCVARHLLEAGTIDPEDKLLHSGKLAWRALALLETELEKAEKSA